MATGPHESSSALPEKQRRARSLLVPEMWASLAIAVIWLAVLFDAIFGPDFVSSSGSGASTTRIPSAILVAVFAYLATRVVARYGFSGSRDDTH
ncbi:MAG: hypothetical protein ACXVFN_01810 [Solirubrobacteraceae bacterium]